jgi:hypothetical protein
MNPPNLPPLPDEIWGLLFDEYVSVENDVKAYALQAIAARDLEWQADGGEWRMKLVEALAESERRRLRAEAAEARMNDAIARMQAAERQLAMLHRDAT